MNNRPAIFRNTLPTTRITPRMAQILSLCANGMTQKDVANKLGISYHTVKATLRDSILPRLGASGIAQAVYLAKKKGLIE